MMACFGCLKNKKQQQKKKKTEEEKEKGVEASRHTALASSAGSVNPCKSTASASPRRGIPDLYLEKAHNLRVFELDELRNATSEFNRMLRIGQGGFGSVYKGFLQPPDGKGDRVAIAIKKLNPKGLQVLRSHRRQAIWISPIKENVHSGSLVLSILFSI